MFYLKLESKELIMSVSTRFGGLYGNITEQAKECQEVFEVSIFHLCFIIY